MGGTGGGTASGYPYNEWELSEKIDKLEEKLKSMGFTTKCSVCGTVLERMDDLCPKCNPPKEKENSS